MTGTTKTHFERPKSMSIPASPSSSAPPCGIMVSPSSSKASHSPTPAWSSSPRIRSPKGTPKMAGLSNTDLLYVGFLKHSKWLLMSTILLAMVQLIVDPLSAMAPPPSYPYPQPQTQPYTEGPASSPTTLPATMVSDDDETESPTVSNGKETAGTRSNFTTKQSLRPTNIQMVNPEERNEYEYKPSVRQNLLVDWKRYNASYSPVIEWNRTGSPPLVQVHLVIDLTSGFADDQDEEAILRVDPASKLLLDGINRSPFTSLVAVTILEPDGLATIASHARRPAVPLVYVVDWGSMRRDCHRLQLVMEELDARSAVMGKEKKEDANGTSTKKVIDDESYTLLLIDFTGSSRRGECDYLRQDQQKSTTKSLSSSTPRTVRLAKRSVVQNRYYDSVTKEIHRGELVPNLLPAHNTTSTWDQSIVIHCPMALRESYVISAHNISKGVALAKLERQVDVSFFWKRLDYSHYGFYRRQIGEIVKSLHHSKITSGKKILMETHVGVAFNDIQEMEAGSLQYEYISGLLSSKIVVIAQRDEWEDHYRLMESLASGALVMSDRMIAPPAGLKDKVNIIFFDDATDLKKHIRYYLQPHNENERKRIALEGYKLAMGRHRSWHRVEELLFGRPVTNVYRPYEPAPKIEAWPDTLRGIIFDQEKRHFR